MQRDAESAMLTGALTESQQCDVVTLSGKASLVITGGSSMQRDSDDILQQSHTAGDRPSSKITILVPIGRSEFTSFFILQSSTLISNTKVSIAE